MVNPYFDRGNIRTFSSRLNESELVWHRDREDRTIEVVEGTGWRFQFDDNLPIELNVGDTIKIPAMKFHRIMKSIDSTDLVLKIQKHKA